MPCWRKLDRIEQQLALDDAELFQQRGDAAFGNDQALIAQVQAVDRVAFAVEHDRLRPLAPAGCRRSIGSPGGGGDDLRADDFGLFNRRRGPVAATSAGATGAAGASATGVTSASSISSSRAAITAALGNRRDQILRESARAPA
jgi:hypothetical protein